MIAGLTMLLAKISAWAEWWGRLFVAVFAAAWDMVKDAWAWPFDQMLEIAVGATNSLDTSGVTGSLSAWGSLPAELVNVLGLLGVGTCISIIAAAIGIRLVLQLIPFTRLGS